HGATRLRLDEMEAERLTDRRLRQRAVDDRLEEAEAVIALENVRRDHAVFVLAHLSPPLSAGGNLARAPSGDRAGTDALRWPARRGQAPRPRRSCARCA